MIMNSLNNLSPTFNQGFFSKRLLQSVSVAVGLCISALCAAVPPLSVEGNKIVSNGEPVSLAGNSLFWSNNGWGGEKFYTAGTVQWLKDDWNSTLVRAAMGVEDEGGYLDDPQGNKAKVTTVVDAAIANDLYVIIDWHSHHAEQNQSEAVAFFEEMAQTYGHHDNVIYEIYNEPLQVSWSGTIKPYAEAVISAIRAIDQDNLIVVGTPTWSQDVDAAAQDPITGYDNIAYALHFYAGTHGQSLRDKASSAMNSGIALFVTEWGTVNADGDGGVASAATDTWMNFLEANDISHANWSINDKEEGASALVPGASTTGGWSGSDLTASGNYVRNLIRNWSGDDSIGSGSSSSNSSSSSSSSSAASGVNLPARIEAEHYDGAPVETTPGNSGSPTACEYRGLDVDVEDSSEGGCNVGWTEPGEQLTYDIADADETYDVTFRLASMDAGQRVSLYVNDTLTDTISSDGGGWQTWTDKEIAGVYIPSNAVITVEFYDGATNLNYMDFSISDGGTSEPPAEEPPEEEEPPTEEPPSEEPPTEGDFPCDDSNATRATNGGTTSVSQGQCLVYNHGNGSIRLGTWSASGTNVYDIRNCNGSVIANVEQVLNDFSVVDTGTNDCDHYIHVKQTSGSYNLQFGSW